MSVWDYFRNSGALRKAAMPAPPRCTLVNEIHGITFVYLAAIVTGVIVRCMVRPPEILIARYVFCVLEISEGVLCHGLHHRRDPTVGVQINFHCRWALGIDCLRAGRKDDGQSSEQQRADPDQRDNRYFRSHSHCLYLSILSIGEFACYRALSNERYHLVLSMARSPKIEAQEIRLPRDPGLPGSWRQPGKDLLCESDCPSSTMKLSEDKRAE